MSKKIWKFNNVEINKKELHASKQPIALNLVSVNQVLISETFEHIDKSFKYFIGYKDDNIVRPFCIILPQMSGYLKQRIDSVLIKYNNEIWNKIKKTLNVKFHNMSVYGEI